MKRNRIFAIAIDEYNDPKLGNLKNCRSDITKILGILNDRYIFDDVEFCDTREKTAKKALYNSLRNFFLNAQEDESILLLYAGHGQLDKALGDAYWQPSDSDSSDLSTWLNLNELVSFIRVTKALNVGIIADTCFSGALFEGMRGGGLESYQNKRSRQALTSGGVEPVSDGHVASPFNIALAQILSENRSRELPFQILGHQVIVEFDKQKRQTPRFDSLTGVNHDGGALIFKLKEETKSNDGTIHERLKNLYIPLPPSLTEGIKNLGELVRQKNAIVKMQKYEEAASIRDKEKTLISILDNEFIEYLKQLEREYLTKVKYDEGELIAHRKLDEKISEFTKELKKGEERKEARELESSKEGEPKEEREKKAVLASKMELLTMMVYEFGDEFQYFNPVTILFESRRDDLIKSFEISIMKFYELVIHIRGTSKSDLLDSSINDLRKIILEVFSLEVAILNSKPSDYFDEIVERTQIELKIFSWIRQKKNKIIPSSLYEKIESVIKKAV